MSSVMDDHQEDAMLDYNYADESRTEHATKRNFQATWKSRQPPPLQTSRESYGQRESSQCSAKAVSFRDDSSLSPSYNHSCNMSYYDQCFETIDKIGEGSFGVVFKTKCKADGKLYAVKKTKVRFAHKWDRLNKIKEVTRLETIPTHPNCVEMIFSWEESDFLYIQLELCETNLETFTRTNLISEDSVWLVLMDLLLAVKHIHDLNIIHLDIKLENIFIAANGRCKLGDFGIAVDVTKDNPTDSLDGDSKYLAPECLCNDFTKAADVFSLGVVTLEIATDLIIPRRGPLWHELRHDIWPMRHLAALSPSIVHAITWMMASSPARRPTVDQLLSLPRLGDLVASVPTTACHEAFRQILVQTAREESTTSFLEVPKCTPPCQHRRSTNAAVRSPAVRSIPFNIRPVSMGSLFLDDESLSDDPMDQSDGFADLSPIKCEDQPFETPVLARDVLPRLRISNSTPRLGKAKLANPNNGSWSGNGRRLFS